MVRKIIKAVATFVLAFSFVFQLCSCIRFRTKYEFMHDSSEIVTIELVECGWIHDEERAYSNTLVTIDDVPLFIAELNEITYKTPQFLKIVQGFNYSELAVKISYQNGDYEFLDAGRKSMYIASEDIYDWNNATGDFNKKQFADLLAKYLSKSQSAVFYFMHDANDIDKIEIVDAYRNDTDSVYMQDKIAEIKDVSLFLSDLTSLTYRYKVQDGVNQGANSKTEHRKAIKIYYTNGDYEVIDNNWRDFYIKSAGSYVNNAYIGEFDLSEYNTLIEKTIKVAEGSN